MSAVYDLRLPAAAPAEEKVGDLIARYLADIGVTTVFGVISIHNMPILDAIFRQQRIRFVTARGEAGAMNMADAYARVSGSLGVVVTSTGTGAGNAAGSQVEALTAGSPCCTSPRRSTGPSWTAIAPGSTTCRASPTC